MTLISKSSGIPISTAWRRLSTGNGRVRCVGEVIQTTIIAPDGRWIVQAKSPHHRPIRSFFDTEADAIKWLDNVTASLQRHRELVEDASRSQALQQAFQDYPPTRP